MGTRLLQSAISLFSTTQMYGGPLVSLRNRPMEEPIKFDGLLANESNMGVNNKAREVNTRVFLARPVLSCA